LLNFFMPSIKDGALQCFVSQFNIELQFLTLSSGMTLFLNLPFFFLAIYKSKIACQSNKSNLCDLE